MAHEKPDNENDVTREGAVEVNEEDLDQAAGGVLIGLNQPADSFSLNYGKIDTNLAGQKVAPTDIVGAGPGGGPHVKKI
jgi:hypothetical protein